MYKIPSRPTKKNNRRNNIPSYEKKQLNNKTRRLPSTRINNNNNIITKSQLYGNGKSNNKSKKEEHFFIKGYTNEFNEDEPDDPEKATELVLKKIRNDIRSSHKRVIDVFLEADEDDSGTLDPTEIKHALSKIGCNLTERDMTYLMQFLDEDGDGEVDYNEFNGKLNATDKERLAAIKKRLGPTPEEKFQMRLEHLNNTALERVSIFTEKNIQMQYDKKLEDQKRIRSPKDGMKLLRHIMRTYKLRARDLLNNIDTNRDGVIDAKELHKAFQDYSGTGNIAYDDVEQFIYVLRKEGKISHMNLYEIMFSIDEDFQENMVRRMPDKETKEKHMSSNSSLPSLLEKDLDNIANDKPILKRITYSPFQSRLYKVRSKSIDLSMEEMEDEIKILRDEIEKDMVRNHNSNKVSSKKEETKKEDNNNNSNKKIGSKKEDDLLRKWRTSGDYNVLNKVFLNEMDECNTLLQNAIERKHIEKETWKTYWTDKMTANAVTIQNAWRTKIAKDFLFRARRDRAACFIQCAIRRRRAYKELQRRKAARCIQTYYRGFHSKMFVKKKRQIETNCAIIIQKIIRKKISRKRMLQMKIERDKKMAKIWKDHTLRVSARLIQRYVRNYQDRMKGYRFRLVVQAMRAKVIQETSRRFAEEEEQKANIPDDLSNLIKMKDDTKATMEWVNEGDSVEKNVLNDISEDENEEDDDNYEEDEFDMELDNEANNTDAKKKEHKKEE